MKDKKLSIGITGNIGSGKSTFCNFIKTQNYPVINADELAKKILTEDEHVKKKIIKSFGEESYADGILNKTYLAQNVFSNPAKVLKINSIVHPILIEQNKKLVNKLFEKSRLVFTEAALIYEADMEAEFDYVVLVSAVLENRKNRVTASGKLSEEEFLRRDSNQIPEEEKKKRADFIFENNGSESDLKSKADFLLMILNNL